jgi:hypothetical protein
MFRSVESTKSVECAPGANVARRMGTFDMASDRPVAQGIMRMSQQSGNNVIHGRAANTTEVRIFPATTKIFNSTIFNAPFSLLFIY